MHEPGASEGSSLPPIPPGRRRQQRTVYSAEQREELEKFFESNHYPSYEERETLAARLNLQEHQVQVWFKNRRAKHRRTQRPTHQRGPEAGTSTRGPGVGAPAAASPVFPHDPVFPSGPVLPGDAIAPGGAVFPGGPGFYSPPPPSSFGGVPAADPSASSHSQAWWDSAQGAPNMAQAAPAPAPAMAPAWSQDPYALNFSPDPFMSPGFTELLSPDDPLEGPSSLLSGYQEEESPDENDSGPRMFLDL